ncbi:hypothetical protein PMIN07_000119 [Paraphaeosphaeria minitans]
MDTPAAEPVRSRSFGGCATCRNRHMKCDEGRPTCSTCRSSEIVCGGYEKAIFFDFEGAPEASSLRFRRPLLTEEERKSMSEWITSAVPSTLVNRSLSQIDEECEEAAETRDVQISHGPFGAFRLIQSMADVKILHAPLNGVVEDAHVTSPQYDELVCATNTGFSPRTQQWIDTIFEPTFQGIHSDIFDIPEITLDGSRIEEIIDDSMIPILDSSSYQPGAGTLPFHPDASYTQMNTPVGCGPGSVVTAAGNIVPSDAVMLLKHYQTAVLQLLTPFRHSKTPWHVLFIPHAKNCLAALTLGESIDSASLCLFHGILAVSAFSMGGLSQSSTWLDQARRYQQYARRSCKSMLKTAYNIPKTAKYKSILMALLTLVQVSMVTGNRDQTECYFLEAEKFIRLRGLNRKKSRKVRLLHHCYAFERILHESTSVESLDSSHRRHVREAVETSGLAIFQDNMSFRLGPWSDLDQDMKRVKGQEEGENDLHLEYPGIWSATLYPEIFGVPETWLFLVSLVIRLTREKDTVQQGGPPSGNLSVKDFLSRAKAVEKCINQMRQPMNIDHCTDPAVENMLDAMQNALSIYFYRKVYDLDSVLLQKKVERVRDCLFKCNPTDSDAAFGFARLLWPVFVAASAAMHPEVQASFALWLNGATRKSGLSVFSGTLNNLERIWQQENMLVDGDESSAQTMMGPS